MLTDEEFFALLELLDLIDQIAVFNDGDSNAIS